MGHQQGLNLPELSRTGELCSLGTLIEAWVEHSYHKLLSLCSKLQGQSEEKRWGFCLCFP